MSSFEIKFCRFILLTGLLCVPARSFCQWELLEKTIAQIIDTSDYLPSFYTDALDYNLMIAAGKGYPTEIERLVKKGADINAVTERGVTPLIFAVANNKKEAVSTLLAYDPDIDKFTTYFENALLIAVKNDFFDIAELLVRDGANVNIGDRYDATPLHYATIYGFTAMADMLIYYDADINPKTSDGSTPLMGAVWSGNSVIADILLQNGAKVEEKDNEGFTPFLLASWFGDTLTMNMLYKAGANIFARTNKGYNALSLAIMSETGGAVDYLLSLDKNWSGDEKSVTDPYTVAAKYQRKDIIELLDKNKVPGHVTYGIDQIALSVSSRFSTHDFYTGFSFTFKEPYLNMGILTGIDTKIWYTRVLMKEADKQYYQYWDKGSLAYAGIFRDFNLSRNANNLVTAFSASVLAGYSFGNNLKGTRIIPENKLKIIPSVSLRWTYNNLIVNLGAEYIKSEFYKNGPVWFRIGVGYNYYLDNIRNRIKFPKWY
ncbi:MAG: ankyrin repeat domain-containing protein [Chloroflexota bacterium]